MWAFQEEIALYENILLHCLDLQICYKGTVSSSKGIVTIGEPKTTFTVKDTKQIVQTDILG